MNSYVNPLQYDGFHLGFSGNWSKALPANPQKLLMDFDLFIETDAAQSHAGYGIYNIDINLSWDMQYRWKPIPALQLSAGGGLATNGGIIFRRYYCNNPASARASIDLTLNAAAMWQTRIGKLPVTVIDRVSLPSLGVCFSPEYGESYYEIYLGNRSGLAHCGWWGNHLGIRNLLAADLKLGIFIIRIGYELNIHSSYICNINTQLVSHSAVIGIVNL